jgi:DNA-binding winged helix-turn-helix (wHTH) protein/tetratricopeptide (TPR) repeat protein
MQARELYEFGEFILEVPERRLMSAERCVQLAPKTYDVLVALVRNAGRLVTKRELLDLVWPDSYVEEGILTVHISALRKALGSRDAFIETVSRSGYRFTDRVTQTREPPRLRIAVLPSLPASGEPSASSGSVGLAIADIVIASLSRFDELIVRPARAIHPWCEPARDAAVAAIGLSVDAVLDSRFRRTGDHVQVSADLVRSTDGCRLWSGEFEEGPATVNGIADRIADAVAAQLGLRPVTVRSLLRSPCNPAVYELLGRGRLHLLSASYWELPKAVEAFREAVELDADYAAAHAGLALAWCAQAELRVAPHASAYGEAKTAALRALGLDSACADAQVALATVLFLSEWDWTGAERSLRRAIELNPNQTEAHVLYGRLMEALGRLEEGLGMKMRALERDPFSPLVRLQISQSYWKQRRYDEALLWSKKTLDADPRHLLAREFLAGIYWKTGDFDGYMAENIRQAETFGAPAEALEPLKQAWSAGGRHSVMQYMLRNAESHGASDIHLAVLYGETGDLNSAFARLATAIESRDPCLVDLAVAPQWDSLRDDPRFRRCLAAIGLVKAKVYDASG